MTQEDDLATRLDKLEAAIVSTRAKLKSRNSWHDGHNLTSGELTARYGYLKEKLNADITDLEAHGHHVTKLEAEVHEWILGLGA